MGHVSEVDGYPLVHSKPMQIFFDLSRILTKRFQSQLAHADVGAVCKAFLYGQEWLGRMLGIGYDLGANRCTTSCSDLDNFINSTASLFQHRQQSSQFNGGSRLCISKGIIIVFPVTAIGAPTQIGHGFDLTGGRFHHDGGAIKRLT